MIKIKYEKEDRILLKVDDSSDQLNHTSNQMHKDHLHMDLEIPQKTSHLCLKDVD